MNYKLGSGSPEEFERLGAAMAAAVATLPVTMRQRGPDALRRRAQALLDQADQLQAELEAKQALYEQAGSEPPDGSVVRFYRVYRPDSPGYHYAAIRKLGRWFVTQGNNRPRGPQSSMSWHQLIDFANASPVELATDWDDAKLQACQSVMQTLRSRILEILEPIDFDSLPQDVAQALQRVVNLCMREKQ